jgi:hypothetical protein
MIRLACVLILCTTTVGGLVWKVIGNPLPEREVLVGHSTAAAGSSTTLQQTDDPSTTPTTEPAANGGTASKTDTAPVLLDRRVDDYEREMCEVKLEVLEAARTLIEAANHCEQSAFEHSVELALYYAYSPSVAALGQQLPHPAEWNRNHHATQLKTAADRLDSAVRLALEKLERIRTRFIKEFAPNSDEATAAKLLPVPATDFDQEIEFAALYLAPRIREFYIAVCEMNLKGSELGFGGGVPEPQFILQRFVSEYQAAREIEAAPQL